MLRICLAITVLLMPWHGVSAMTHFVQDVDAKSHSMVDVGMEMDHGQTQHDIGHMAKHGDCSFSGHCCAVAFSNASPLVNNMPACFNELPTANAVTIILPAELKPPRTSNI